MKVVFYFLIPLIIFLSSCQSPSEDYAGEFPYGNIPRDKPSWPLSAAMNRVYEGSFDSLEVASNELF
ncbi:MAG: hypothetical protein AAF696_17060, partial [Bacteroidota bacterium]